MKNTGRHNPHLNALQGVSCLPVRGSSPHRQAHMAPDAALGPTVPAGEFHEAATGRINIHSARSRPGRWILLWPISLGYGIITKVNGNDIKAFLFHSVMIHGEWSSKGPISLPLCWRNESWRREWSSKELLSFPLWRQKERDSVNERRRARAREPSMRKRRPEATPGRVSHRGNVSPATPGRVDGPAACAARRGPDGVRGGRRFLRPCKNPRQPRTSHGRHPFPQADGRQNIYA